MPIYKLCCSVSILLLLILPVLQMEAQPTLEAAAGLYNQYKLSDSYDLYNRIAGDPSYTDSVRAIAYQKLADQRWKFYHDCAGANKLLETAKLLRSYGKGSGRIMSEGAANAIKTDASGIRFSINSLQATINTEAGRYKLAWLMAGEDLGLARTEMEKFSAGLVFARVVHDQAFASLTMGGGLNGREKEGVSDGARKGMSPGGGRGDLAEDLKRSSQILNQLLEKQPGNPEASELLIGVSLLLKNGDGILKGWKSYYLISNEETINQVLKPGFDLLKSIRGWEGTPLSITALERLATGFAGTKFFNYANFVAGEIRERDAAAFNRSAALQDIVAYYAYINDVKKVNDIIYPAVAKGKTNYDHEYDSLQDKVAMVLWSKLSFGEKGGGKNGGVGSKGGRAFNEDTFYYTMNRRFDMEGYSGNTVNYYGMLMGHIIYKELKQIDQYGYSTKFTYVSVDRLISRDFTSWYGTTNVGGWGDSATIIQVRKAYMTEPFQLLNWMTDPAEHKRMEVLIAKKKEEDLARCTKDPYAEPSFLAISLKFNEASKIYQHLSDSGLKGMDLNIAFIGEILKLTIASTVFAHEGRHAIDQLYFAREFASMSDDERELRAKYSEVIFSLNPKMAFTGSILGSDLDENTNHGKANSRFRHTIVDWMSAHLGEINGIDRSAPLLMQFDLLTDAQLIAICKSADPLAKNGTMTTKL
jgi:hypothetical protein